MRPLLLKGHERPLTRVRFNREGDLIVSCAKDHKPALWFADTGERIGTYNGHVGTVWDADFNFNSTRLITGSSDCSAKLWELETGKQLYSLKHSAGIRSVSFAHGEKMILCAQDSTFSSKPTIFIYNLPEEFNAQSIADNNRDEPVRSLHSPDSGKVATALWGALNTTIIAGSDDGCVRLWDVETGKEIQKVKEFKKPISDLQFSKDHTMFIASSGDHTAKIFDSKTLKVLKTFQSSRPLNSAAISPVQPHVLIGGGQEAMDVTTTSTKAGHFEVDFFNLVYQDFLGSVKGHFGPVNTIAVSPSGRSYASGAEDGYIRLHHFEKSYFSQKHNHY